jgi:Tfp pilus assembly protein PilW
MSSSTPSPKRKRKCASGFTLVEVMVAAGLSGFVLAGVLSANLQIVRGGIRVTQYAEMESQVRRAYDYLGRDLREALDIRWNGESDITLRIPTGSMTSALVTYAWTPSSRSFFRVAGASSTAVVGRLELVRGVPPLADGSAGLKFARYDRDGAAATTDAATRGISVTMTVVRSTGTLAASRQNAVSARFSMRNKPSS